MAHSHGGVPCNHDHSHENLMESFETKIKNIDNLEIPAEADIDLDAMHPEVQLPQKEQQWPLTEEELAADFVMITEDGGIKKKILTESKQPELGSPPNGSKVICHYTGTLPQQNDEKFDSSRDRNDPFTFKIGQGQVIKGWDLGIASMKKGERCILRCAAPYAYGANGSPPKIPGGATLDFDVELIEWDDWEELSGAEQQISKKILVASEEGYDAEIGEDDQVNITYRVYYVENGIDQILVERKKFDMIADDDDRFTEGFHLCLRSMKKGEKALFKIKDMSLMNVDDLYIDPEELKQEEFNNNKRTAPDGKMTFYEIMVHGQVKATEKWNAKNEERIENGAKYKEDGNVMFKQGRMNGAINKYQKALDWIDVDFSDDTLAQKKKELVISCNNNLSLIYIKLKDWSEATEHATKVLDVDGNNLKALMRRGQALMQNGFLERSKKDLKKAQNLDKNNSVIKKMLKIVTVKHKQYIEKQQKLYAGMFGGNKSKKKKKKAKKVKTEDVGKNEDKGGDDKGDKKEKEEVNKIEIDKDKAVSV